MIGNKYAANEIARNFHQRMKKIASLNKASQKKVAKKKKMNPEDFLVTPSEELNVHEQQLENRAEEVSSYAKDSCSKCGKEHSAKDGCGDMNYAKSHNEAKDEDEAEDTNYLVDKRCEFVLYNLGKIAGEMRRDGHGFAADMVQVTANKIKNDAVKEASKKLAVVNNLKKMASNAYAKGDFMTGDVISVTINNITKKG